MPFFVLKILGDFNPQLVEIKKLYVRQKKNRNKLYAIFIILIFVKVIH